MNPRATGPSIEAYRTEPYPSRVSGGTRPKAYRADLPLVSVVCICRNAERALGRCIKSVADQDYANIEFIIFDGASTDGTVEVLRQFDREITFWASEPDKGRNDAFNKALAAASGEYLTVVMADDWLSPDFITASVEALKRHGTDYVFGDRMLHAPDGTVLYKLPGSADFAKGLRNWMTINSPSFTIRRRLLEEIGLFNDISVASDYDWFLRAHNAGFRGAYDPSILYHFEIGGLSTFNAFQGYRDNMLLALKYGARPSQAFLAYLSNVSMHCAREVLAALLPDAVVLSLRRFRQKLKGSLQ